MIILGIVKEGLLFWTGNFTTPNDSGDGVEFWSVFR